MAEKTVLVIGGGVAGLSTALDVARSGIGVTVVERTPFPGGHGIQFSCKATDACVKCGACMVEEKLALALAHPDIRLLGATDVQQITRNGRFAYSLRRRPSLIDPESCTNCGTCRDACPEGAVITGTSGHHHPFYAIADDTCRHATDPSCTACQDACPEGAIRLDREPATESGEADALIVATGFRPFDPIDKPYGYGTFPNVITNLQLERMLRRQGRALRPSDGNPPQRIAFIQCVGSRDAKLKHLWCSKVCCASALRMARLIRSQDTATEITVFHIDIQTFGRDFDAVYRAVQEELRFNRAIPCDIFENPDKSLRVAYFSGEARAADEATFDLVVLSIGLLPGSGAIAGLDLPRADTGFLLPGGSDSGVFATGTARGPMSIADTIAAAGETARQVVRFLNGQSSSGVS